MTAAPPRRRALSNDNGVSIVLRRVRILGPASCGRSGVEGALNRRPWPVAALLVVALAVAGCGTSPQSDTEQLARELAEVKADRDQLATLAKQMASQSATLEAYAVTDRQGCLDTLRAVRQRLDDAHTALKAGKADSKNAAVHLSSARRGLYHALAGDCAQATP
jgi:hypothetical protein